MEEVSYIIRDNAQAVGRRSVVAVSNELASLESAQGLALLRGEVGARGFEPIDGFLLDKITVRVVDERICAVRDQVGEDIRGWSVGGGCRGTSRSWFARTTEVILKQQSRRRLGTRTQAAHFLKGAEDFV